MRICSSCQQLLPPDTSKCPEDGADGREVAELPAGARIGQYRIVKVLGEGGMGFVYEANHEVLDRRCAVKFLRPEFAGDAEVVARFMQEAKAVNLIDHDNIVSIYDYGDAADGSAYFVMEYLEGETLADLIHRRGPLPPALLLHIFSQLGRALSAAHARQIVHRDLKPANVFLVRRESDPFFVKLLDFGVAKLRGSAAMAKQTALGTVMGTPQYMSPEQVQGLAVDARSDVWALGVMIYRAASAKLPFQGDDFAKLAGQILGQAPPPLSKAAPGVPAALERLVEKALRRDLEQRAQSVDALLADLERLRLELGLGDEAMAAALAEEARLGGEGGGHAPSPSTATGALGLSNPIYQGVPEAVAGGKAAPVTPSMVAASARSRTPLFVGAGVLAALLVVGGVVLAGRGGGKAEQAAAKAPPPALDDPAVKPQPPAPAKVSFQALAAAGDQAALAKAAESSLREAAGGGDLAALADVVTAVDLVGTARGAPLLYEALGGGPEIRLRAARALAAMRLPESAPKLKAALDKSGDKLRVELAACLIAVGDRDAVALLEQSLADPATRVTAAVALAEAGRGEAAKATLAEIVKSTPAGRESWRRASAALARLGDARARDGLLAELTQSDPARVLPAAEALAGLGDQTARATLARLAGDAGFERRAEAALALARLGDQAGLGFAEAGLASARAEERKLAAAVVARLAPAGSPLWAAVAKLADEDTDRGVRLTAQAAFLGR